MLYHPSNILNGTSVQELPAAMLGSVDLPAMYNTISHLVLKALWDLLNLSTLWRAMILVFLIMNAKNLPLVYHLRLLNAFRFVLHSLRTEKPISPDQLFQPLITSSQCPLAEIDLYMHKSNSSYFTDVDIARTHLICTLFARGIEKVRGGTSGIVGGKVSNFAVALGAVSCSFRRELKPYEKYDLYTRVLSWDQKWLYVVTHFVKKGAVAPSTCTLYPQQSRRSSSVRGGSRSPKHVNQEPDKAIVASALSKLVFKKGRITIAPEVMLEASGLLPEKVEEIKFFKDKDVVNTPALDINTALGRYQDSVCSIKANIRASTNPDDLIAAPTKVTQMLSDPSSICESPSSLKTTRADSVDSEFDSSCSSSSIGDHGTPSRSISPITSPEDSSDENVDPFLKPKFASGATPKRHSRHSHTDSPSSSVSTKTKTRWTRGVIELERRRGMAMARLLAEQADLANEFVPGLFQKGLASGSFSAGGSSLASSAFPSRANSIRGGSVAGSVRAGDADIGAGLAVDSSEMEVLGRHTDGCGIKGVVSTLAQLGRITRTSSL